MKIEQIIGREKPLFVEDIARHESTLREALKGSRVLLIGGAGSIGKEVAKELFRRNPAALHVIDLSENNLVELVRELRSTMGYMDGETKFMPLDMAGPEIACFLSSQAGYDYVLNLAAMKHVRSEKDAYCLMRMVRTNVIETLAICARAQQMGAKKYFAVSTDKAKNPANLMGATKRIMEEALFREGAKIPISTARFANVAFSDGSLLHGFRQRVLLRQPISAPRDVRRYFVTGPESGQLCLASLILGCNREIFFPKLDADESMLTFSEIAVRFLAGQGFKAREVSSEEEARARADEMISAGEWPCYFFDSDTAGEKPFEEFYSGEDVVAWDRFADIGVIAAPSTTGDSSHRIDAFLRCIQDFRTRGSWDKSSLVTAISAACPELSHVDVARSLDDKM